MCYNGCHRNSSSWILFSWLWCCWLKGPDTSFKTKTNLEYYSSPLGSRIRLQFDVRKPQKGKVGNISFFEKKKKSRKILFFEKIYGVTMEGRTRQRKQMVKIYFEAQQFKATTKVTIEKKRKRKVENQCKTLDAEIHAETIPNRLFCAAAPGF